MRCSFERLIQCLDGRLDTDNELEVFDHVERCDLCFDTMYELVRERNLRARSGVSAGMSLGTPSWARHRQPDSFGLTTRGAESRSLMGRRQKRMLPAKSRGSACRAFFKSRCGA